MHTGIIYLLARHLGQGDGKGCQLLLVILLMLSTTSFIFLNFLSPSSHSPKAFPHFNNLTVALQRWCMNIIYLCFWEEQLEQNLSLGCSNLRTASLADGEEYCREPGTARFAGATSSAHKQSLTYRWRLPICCVTGREDSPLLGYIKQNACRLGAWAGSGNCNISSFSLFWSAAVADKLLASLPNWFRTGSRKLGTYVLHQSFKSPKNNLIHILLLM